MGYTTGIEWTDSTWNPVTGCTRVSRGCDHCYAAELAATRLRDTYLRRLPVVDTPERREDPFGVRLWPERLDQPFRWAEPRMVFVNSMSDLFHVEIPEAYIRKTFEVMLSEDRHTYQVLTKRPGRALRFFKRNTDLLNGLPLPAHVWIGTSVEDQEATPRIAQLKRIPAEVRFLSCEPLLGPIQLDLSGIHWVVVGGESGPGRRPMKSDWARAIRDACVDQGIPFFFKQWGGITPKAGGRELDGELWDEHPAPAVR